MAPFYELEAQAVKKEEGELNTSFRLFLLLDYGCNVTKCFTLLLPWLLCHESLYLQTVCQSKPLLKLFSLGIFP